jgi:hypothetical protein
MRPPELARSLLRYECGPARREPTKPRRVWGRFWNTLGEPVARKSLKAVVGPAELESATSSVSRVLRAVIRELTIENT